MVNPAMVHVVPVEVHEEDDVPEVAVAVKSRIGSTDPPALHVTASAESDSCICVMTGALGSGATVSVSIPRVPPKPTESVRPDNNSDVAEEPGDNCVVPSRCRLASRKEAIRGPEAVSVVAYRVPVDSSATRFRAPLSPESSDAEPTTVLVGMSIAVIRPGVAVVPR